MKAIVGALIAASMFFAPTAADARTRCDSKLLVWSGTVLIVTGTAPTATCIHGTTETADSRLISGDHLMVTFDSTYLKGQPFVMAAMSGLGWTKEFVPLAFDKGKAGTNDDIYKSGFMEIPHGFEANGCLTVSLKVTERRGRKTITSYSDVQKYHTAGVTC